MSIWKLENIEHTSLKNNIEVHTLIIGGGLTGLLTAYSLNDSNNCVVEARTIGSGVTKNTTAKITYLQDKIYTKMKKEKRTLYLKSQIESVKKLKSIIDENNIDCDLVNTPSYIFAQTKKEIPILKREVNFLKKNKINIIKSQLPSNISSCLAYKVNDTYTFNPLKFLSRLYNILNSRNIKVYENTKIINIKKEKGKYTCTTEKDLKITANNVIISTNYPYFVFPFIIELKSLIEKSHIIVSHASKYKNFSMINVGKKVYSCRYYKDIGGIYQISLGNSHNIAFKNNDQKNFEKDFEKVRKQFKLNEQNIIMEYSNTDLITPDYIPYIGKIKNNMYISTGYNTWGMTNSMLASLVLKDLIENKENEYTKLLNPKRITLSHIIKLPYYLLSQTKSFISSKLLKNKSWYKENIKNYYKVGPDVAIYIDSNNIEHKVKNKCPHLGCSLIFNETEKTWDCPCHSSRFDVDGNCIKGPSNKNIKL